MAAGAQGEADRQRSGTCHFPGADAAPEKNPGRGPKADYSNAIYIFISPKRGVTAPSGPLPLAPFPSVLMEKFSGGGRI